MKKIISLFLTLSMFFTFMPAVFARDLNVMVSGDFVYTSHLYRTPRPDIWIDEDPWHSFNTLYEYTGNRETVIVPLKVPYNVILQRIGELAFAGNTTVKNVSMPEVVAIGPKAFSGCSNLENIAVNAVHAKESVCRLTICEYAFENCIGLKRLVLPAHTYRIEDGAFSGCSNLKEVIIPKKTISISNDAFEECNEDLTIVCDPGSYAESYAQENEIKFRYATESDLETDSFAPENNIVTCGDFQYSWGSDPIDDWVFDALYKYTGNSQTVIVPEKVPESESYAAGPVAAIEDFAFAGNTKIINAMLPEIDSIGARAFSGCRKLKNIIINVIHEESSGSRLSIGEYAFENCVSLKKFIVPANTYTINEGAFSGCSNLKEIVIQKNLITIADNAFEGCPDDLTIVCYPGGFIETYAKQNGFNFRYITEADLEEPLFEYDNSDSAQPESAETVESVSIKGAKNITLTDGKSKKLSAAVSPKGGSDIVWTTSNKKTVSVNKSGKITAKKPGKAVITATAGEKKAKVTVKVIPKAVKKLKVSKKARRITIGLKKADKSYKTYIEYRKKGAKKYKKLALTGKTRYQKRLKKGRYQIRACSYVKTGGAIYKSGFTKPKTINIK